MGKTSTKLAKTKAVIVIEDLQVKGMMQNRKLSRHIADAGWGGSFAGSLSTKPNGMAHSLSSLLGFAYSDKYLPLIPAITGHRIPVNTGHQFR
jgi:hypothetical protein